MIWIIARSPSASSFPPSVTGDSKPHIGADGGWVSLSKDSSGFCFHVEADGDMCTYINMCREYVCI